MVRAILDGRKTQTRRVMKPQPPDIAGLYWDRGLWYMPPGEPADVSPSYSRYDVGDHLYVRESAWYPEPPEDEIGPQFCADATEADLKEARRVLPRAGWKFHPSIHMPKWAARTWLEVTKVRVERVQEISDDDIIAEGVDASSSELQEILTAGAAETHTCFWVYGEDCGESYCEKCIDAAVERARARGVKDAQRDGGWPTSSDVFSRCETCDALLDVNPTAYCMEQEAEGLLADESWTRADRALLASVLSSADDYLDEDPPLHPLMQRLAWNGLWDSINAKRGYGWDVNPWVWCYDFKVISTEGKK